MKKLLVTLSLFTFSTTLLMANLSPEYSADVNSLKAEYAVSSKTEKVVKKEERKKESVPTYSRDVKIIKVLKYSDITNYTTSHKLLKTKVLRGSVKKSDIITQANELTSAKVLVFVQNNIRYIYFYTN